MKARKQLTIKGQVQGIGFRPYIYKIAKEYCLTGLVYNHSSGVCIQIQGIKTNIQNFIDRLCSKPYEIPLMKISQIDSTDIDVIENEKDFTISQSISDDLPIAQVTADIAICKNCLSELFDKTDFRLRYPFINCTNCGPRYSIIKTIPYDRPNTTMEQFKMCRVCKKQYDSITDRRFHAQPVACEKCGPKIWLTDNTGKTIESNQNETIKKAVQMLLTGSVLAVKGLGGFHLMADAQNQSAVEALRQRKKRDYKPFAMMAENVSTIREFAKVDKEAEKLLQSPQAPIVLLPQKINCAIASSVAKGVNTFGFILAYTPLHHLLFSETVDGKKLKAIVATSGNVSDEPLICDNQTAITQLSDIAEAFVLGDRIIYRQIDDSVLHIIDGSAAILRRARGFVPGPIIGHEPIDIDVFAAGGDLKNTFCIVRQNQFIVSEHIGDLAKSAVYKHWLKSIKHLQQLFCIEPAIAVCDLHPGYLSSRHCQLMKNDKPNLKILEVQHHWAHIASVLTENEFSDKKVIGLVADGSGYGTDGAVWGCECLTASLNGFKRFGHMDYFTLAGGDTAAKKAIKPIMGIANKYGIEFDQSILEKIEPDKNKIEMLKNQLNKNINTVKTSSMGRLFDAVAALCGLGSENNFEAQLPMALEAVADENIKGTYSFELSRDDGPVTVNIGEMIKAIVCDLKNNTDTAVISAKFHNTVAALLCSMALRAGKQTGIDTVAISGGVFCNRFLSNRLIGMLRDSGFNVLFNRTVPSNDGGISLGQAAIATFKYKNGTL